LGSYTVGLAEQDNVSLVMISHESPEHYDLSNICGEPIDWLFVLRNERRQIL